MTLTDSSVCKAKWLIATEDDGTKYAPPRRKPTRAKINHVHAQAAQLVPRGAFEQKACLVPALVLDQDGQVAEDQRVHALDIKNDATPHVVHVSEEEAQRVLQHGAHSTRDAIHLLAAHSGDREPRVLIGEDWKPEVEETPVNALLIACVRPRPQALRRAHFVGVDHQPERVV